MLQNLYESYAIVAASCDWNSDHFLAALLPPIGHDVK